MADKGESNAEAIKIQGLIDRYLRIRSAGARAVDDELHLDEDLLTAFVEGRISERESPPVLKHLVDCSFCMRITSELARLNYAFAEEDHPVAAPTSSEPVRASDVLNSLISRIFGAGGGEVFAHHEMSEEETKPETKDETNS